METKVRPSKRPRTDDEAAVPTVDPKDDALCPHDSKDCLCPICLDSCTPERSFALPCCNGQLSEGEPAQRIHKTCFFAYARSVIEPKVADGESLIFMPDSALKSLIQCPRCRSDLPLNRSCRAANGVLQIMIVWPIDNVIICDSRLFQNDSHTEHSYFYNVVSEGLDTMPRPYDRSIKKFIAYQRVSYHQPVAYRPTSFTHEVLGFEDLVSPSLYNRTDGVKAAASSVSVQD